MVHSRFSSSLVRVITANAAIAITNGIIGSVKRREARTTVNTEAATFQKEIFSTLTSEYARTSPKNPVIYHLFDHMKYHPPLSTPSAGLPQFAKTRISTSAKKCRAVCHSGRFSGGMATFICASSFSFSSFLKIHAIISPITIANTTAPRTRASPSSHPRILAVRIMARIFMAGPE